MYTIYMYKRLVVLAFQFLSTQRISQASSLSESSWSRKTSCLPWSLPLPALVLLWSTRKIVHRQAFIVQPGDVCDGISAEYNVSTYQLATVNEDIIDPACDNLQVGEGLCLSLDRDGLDCKEVHVVQDGESCSTIASQANITIGELLTDNPNVNAACTNIYPGEVLCVAPISTNTTST